MKIREWLKKIRHRSAKPKDGERSADTVIEAFTVASGEAPSSWIPSQQDRPPH